MLLFLAADSCYGATRAAFGKNKRKDNKLIASIGKMLFRGEIPRELPRLSVEEAIWLTSLHKGMGKACYR